MPSERVMQLARNEAALGANRVRLGVAGRVLKGAAAYPEELVEFETRLNSEAAAILKIATETPVETLMLQARQAQQIVDAILQDQNLHKHEAFLQTLLPYNVKEILNSVGPIALYRDVLYHAYRLATALLVTQFLATPTVTAEAVANVGVLLSRFAYDLQAVIEGLIGSNQPEPLAEPTLAEVARQGTAEHLQSVLGGAVPVTQFVEEDVESLLGAVLRPLHGYGPLVPTIALPGSVVTSDAALVNLLETTEFRKEAAVSLTALIKRFLQSPAFGISLADQEVTSLIVLGTETLRDYYRANPPAQPLVPGLASSAATATTPTATTETLLDLADQPPVANSPLPEHEQSLPVAVVAKPKAQTLPTPGPRVRGLDVS